MTKLPCKIALYFSFAVTIYYNSMLQILSKSFDYFYYNDIKVTADGFHQENVIDTTGAGDTFCGCMLSYICDNGLSNLTEDKLYEMIRYANAAASIVTTRAGAILSMPSKEEIERCLNG